MIYLFQFTTQSPFILDPDTPDKAVFDLNMDVTTLPLETDRPAKYIEFEPNVKNEQIVDPSELNIDSETAEDQVAKAQTI